MTCTNSWKSIPVKKLIRHLGHGWNRILNNIETDLEQLADATNFGALKEETK